MKVKLIILALLMPALAFAQYIDEKDARAIAASALKKNADRNGVRKAPSAQAADRNGVLEPYVELHRVVRDAKSNRPCFYIYNQKGGAEGFAIVSNQGQLLARSERGAMDYDHAPENVKWLLGQYQKYLSDEYAQPYPDEDVADEEEGVPSLYRFSIEPMIGCAWHQNSPFCNKIYEKYMESGMSEPEHGVPAGCSTIAMAQVMYYWKHPQRGTGTKKWKVGKEKYDVNFEEPIDWAHLPSTATKGSETALSELCLNLAASINAEPGDGGTSANSKDIVNALKNIYDYDKSIKYDYFSFREPEIFEDLAFRELEQGRPVIIGGQDAETNTWWPFDLVGHQMVVEGYDVTTDHFFINMGWGPGGQDIYGPYNAYYALCVDNKYYTFTMFQDIITHIKPDGGGRATPQIVGRRFAPAQAHPMKMTKSRRVVEYDKNEGQKSYHVQAEIFSNDMDADIVTGIMAKDFVTGKECVFEGSTHQLKQNYIQYMDFDIDLSNIDYNGYYMLRPVFRMADGDEWFIIQIMKEDEEQDPYQPDYVDVSNADVLDLGIEIDFALDCASLQTGETTQIEYSLPIKGVPVTFTSSDPSVVSVDSNGMITALQAGTATITAHCDDYMFNGNRLVRETTKEFAINAETSALKGVEMAKQPQNQKVYNLQGVSVGVKDQLLQMPVGLYILDGKLIQKQ